MADVEIDLEVGGTDEVEEFKDFIGRIDQTTDVGFHCNSHSERLGIFNQFTDPLGEELFLIVPFFRLTA